MAEETYREPGKWDRSFTVPVGPYVTTDSDGWGVITVDSDAPNQGSNIPSVNGFYIQTRSDNSGNGYVGFTSDVDSDNGIEVSSTNPQTVFNVQNLNELWFTPATIKFGWWKK